MNRRHYLRLLGGVAGAGALAGCGEQDPDGTAESPTPGASPTTSRSTAESPTSTPTDGSGSTTPSAEIPEAPVTRHGITFDRVRHAVDDLGMDPTGGQPIDGALDEAYGDGTLIVFPPGKYLAAKAHAWKESVAGFGMLGLGESHEDVQFVFPKGNEKAEDPSNHWFLHVKNGRDHLLENVTIQQTRDKVTGVGMVFYQEDGLNVRDVELAGFNPAWDHDPGFGLVAAITSRRGVGVIERFTCTGGGVIKEYPKRKTPIGSFRNHQGELRILEPHIEESGSHSMYVSRTRGCVRVEDGLFKNNDNTNLRMSGGGHPQKRSWAKNCEIVIDIENAKHLPDGEHYQGLRAFWIESGGDYEYGYSDLLVENLSVTERSNANPLPMILIEHSHGSVTMRNSTLKSAVDGVAPIFARNPDTSFVTKPYAVTLDEVDLVNEASYTTTGYAVSLNGRPQSRLRNLSVKLASGSIDGILVNDCDDARIVNTTVATPDGSLLTPTIESAELNAENVGLVIRASKNYLIRNSRFDVPGEAKRILSAQEIAKGNETNKTGS